MKKEFVWRWTFFISGVLLMSLGISMTIKGQRLGIGPWDVLHVGLFKHLGLTIGTWSILTGIIIVIGTVIGTKQLPKLGTWLNILLIGSFIDIFNWMIPDIQSYGGQVLIYLAGLIVMAIGVGVYVSPNVGAGPRDSLMLLIMKKTGWSIKNVRTGLEVLVACIGWILGGPVGIGTVAIALLLGQLVHYTLPSSQKLLFKISGYSQFNTLKSAENQK
ncbi:YitT family protein [Psychrobacillus sp.]|uniref:YczE/YyaS/YitT family protein n=1 Tax=Psychrobacillus sp. TaxID=1871623 RepID=UPI0028BD7CB5|nr:YitT family protein [Psychrobacillus sp.]